MCVCVCACWLLLTNGRASYALFPFLPALTSEHSPLPPSLFPYGAVSGRLEPVQPLLLFLLSTRAAVIGFDLCFTEAPGKAQGGLAALNRPSATPNTAKGAGHGAKPGNPSANRDREACKLPWVRVASSFPLGS